MNAASRRRAGLRWAVGLWMLAGTIGASAQVNMPAPSEIHGRAIPAPELPDGTVTVRVVREALGNNVSGQEVRVTTAGTGQTATTDAQGRAQFTGLRSGADAIAEATVDGERLVSQPFAVPASGGLRVILIAGIERAAARRQQEAAAGAAAPAVPGAIVLGPNSRILMQFEDDALQVFYVLEILNSARTPVDIGGPLIVDLPSGAGGAAVLEGSSPSATVSGDRVTVTGPFAPGATSVQVGFRLRLDDSSVTVGQTFPAPLQEVTVAVEKIGALAMTSSQFASVGEVRSDDGTPFLLARGPALPAGAALTLELVNVPAHSRLPQWVALGLAVSILGIGAGLAISARGTDQGARQRLVKQRDALLGELASLEERRRRRSALPEDPKEAAKRQRLLNELERLYGELDEAGYGPEGGGEGIAA